MKKGILLVFLTVFLINFASAAQCQLNTTLLNQDPSPAVPGEYVKLVFQVTGLENPECKDVYFKLVPEYPIIFDSDTSSEVKVKGGTYTSNYISHLQVPYKVRVDENAIDGNNEIKVLFSSNNVVFTEQKFNLYVEDIKVHFDSFVKNYDYTTGTLTLQVLNIGNSDIEALTIEIPKQEGITIKGSNKNVLGSLSSNEDTTTDFEAYFIKETNFNIIIAYTDKNSVRRTVSETVNFNPEYFQGRNTETKGTPSYYYIIAVIVVIIIAYFIYKKMKKKKLR